MQHSTHNFHIPVMGTGHSIDTPIRVAPFGIDSVISIVDDLLLEKIRKYYSSEYELPFTSIGRNAEDGRARRITAYLDMVQQIVQKSFEEIKNSGFKPDSDKYKYFELLPDQNPVRLLWNKWKNSIDATDKNLLEQLLNDAMLPGSIDVNIMSKVDFLGSDTENKPLSSEFSDACAALRGFAKSAVDSAVVLSAGFNPRLYNYIANFSEFYRDASGQARKKIILKVSDFRSALIQGKFLAKKGLEVAEFRIESGLNCGGHAFYSDGRLLPVMLEEFKNKKESLTQQLQPLIESFYEKAGMVYPESARSAQPKITVQGGIGTHGETERLLNNYQVDGTGWGSPFLVVPEATCIDDPTLQLLINSTEDDLYLSKVSPLGVPFNNLRSTGSEQWTDQRIASGTPGSQCPKGFLKTNTEFTENAICTASSEYQILKLEQINSSDLPEKQKSAQTDDVLAKTCLCNHLGNGSLLKLGIIKEKHGPQAICPGPNMAWFSGPYSLKEMVDHIYGRTNVIDSDDRPHMFLKELDMNLDYFESLVILSDPDDAQNMKYLKTILKNLEEGFEHLQTVCDDTPYPGENLQSLRDGLPKQEARLKEIWDTVEIKEFA